MTPFALAAMLLQVATPLAPPPDATGTKPEPPNPYETRPLGVAVVAGLGMPTGLMGLTVDYAFEFPFVAELGGGLGLTGLELSLRARHYWLLGARKRWSIFAAAGPSTALISEALGLRVPHRDDQEVEKSDVYYTAWMNAGVGGEIRWTAGGFGRFELGGMVRMASTIDDLCRGVDGNPDTPGPTSCKSYHYPTAPEISRAIALPYMGAAFGWSF